MQEKILRLSSTLPTFEADAAAEEYGVAGRHHQDDSRNEQAVG